MQMPSDEQRKIGDHYKFTSEELGHWSQYEDVALEGDAGSLFLWDSRTVHAVSSFCRMLHDIHYGEGKQ